MWSSDEVREILVLQPSESVNVTERIHAASYIGLAAETDPMMKGAPDLVKAAITMLDDVNETVRIEVARSLGCHASGADTIEALARTAQSDSSAEVRLEALRSFEALAPASEQRALARSVLTDPDIALRREANHMKWKYATSRNMLQVFVALLTLTGIVTAIVLVGRRERRSVVHR
jgi:D-serine deaminase-like pyridoxal phosphate-dependent protein